MQIARRLMDIKPSPTLAVTAKAQELEAAGRDIIGLGAGELDFDTPDFIVEAAIQAIRSGDTRYTAVGGTLALKKAIIEKCKRDNHLTYSPQEIIVGTGAKQVLFNAFLATLNPGDEVIIPTPYWVSYPDMVTIADGTPVIVPTHWESGFILTPEALEAAITPRTKWLILNSPSNPSGATYHKAELEALAEVLRRHPHVAIIADDIYEKIVYETGVFHSFATVAPDLKERTLTVNGVSKSHAMTGWRIGYGAGPAPLIKAMTNLQSQSTSNPCSISQAAAVAALSHDDSFLEPWRRALKERRDRCVDQLTAIPGLQCSRPEGAFYLFVNARDHHGKGCGFENDIAFSNFLLETANVAVVPGSAFGVEGFFRISYATSLEKLERAIARIHKALADRA